MEGEGITAVIRALPDGTAVVLMQGRLQELGAGRQNGISEPRRCWEMDAPTRLRSVETGTTANISVNADAQACDGHYTSTYQLAHGSVLPTSPPLQLPEFPLQRSEPCRTQGNFEVGSVEYRSRSPSPTSYGRLRGMSLDRGSYSPRAPDREAELFANSLRRYPTAPPHPPTAELLQKLIKQAQDKYAAKTQPAKSTRSVRKKISPVFLHEEKPSKSLQTYTRSSREHPKTSAAVTRVRSGFKSPSPGSSREIRARETFDYLNNSIPLPPPGAASGDRRAVRDSIRTSLRQVFGDARGPVTAFPVCPNIRSRYEQHRREHHVCDEPTPGVDEACGSPNSLPWGTTCAPPEPCAPITVENQLVCCTCDQPVPCTCNPSPICHCKETRPSEDEIQEKRKLEEIVCSWLDDLPVSAKEKPGDKFIRDVLIKKLIDTLDTIKDDEFDTKGREEIEQCIDKMPMWYPSDKKEREKMRKDLIDSLFDSIRGFRKRDRFKEEIAKWLDTIDFASHIDKNKVVDDISKALKDISLNRPPIDSIYRDKLKCKIFDLLQDLPVSASVDKDEIANLKSELLADQLISLPKNVIKPDSYFEQASQEAEALKQFEKMKEMAKNIADREFGGIILNALNEIDGLRNLSEEKKQKAIKELISNLPNLLADDEELVAKEMYDQIHDWLVKLAADNGVDIPDKTKRDFIDGLVDTLEDSLATHLQLGESMTGFLSDLPKPPKIPEGLDDDLSPGPKSDRRYSFSKGQGRRLSAGRRFSEEPHSSKQVQMKGKSNISDLRHPSKQRPSYQNDLDDEGSPASQRSYSGKRTPSPLRYPTGQRRMSEQGYQEDDGSPSPRVSGGKKSISPQRERRPSQSYTDDDGSPTGQRDFSGKRSQSPQPHPTGKRRSSDYSRLDVEGSPTSPRGIGKRSQSPQQSPAGKRRISDQSYANDEEQSIDNKRGPSPQRHPEDKPYPSKSASRPLGEANKEVFKAPGHLKGGSKISDQQKINEKGYLSDESMSSDPQTIDDKGYPSNRDQKRIGKTTPNQSYLQSQSNNKRRPHITGLGNIDGDDTFSSEQRRGPQTVGQRSIDQQDNVNNKPYVGQQKPGQNVDQPQSNDKGMIQFGDPQSRSTPYSRDQDRVGSKLHRDNDDNVDKGNLSYQGSQRVSGGGKMDDKSQPSSKGGKSQSNPLDNDARGSPKNQIQGSMKDQGNVNKQELLNRSLDEEKPHMKEESKKIVEKIKDWLNHYREKAGFSPKSKQGNKEEIVGRVPRSSVQIKDLESMQDSDERFAKARRFSDSPVKQPVARRKVSFSSDDENDLLNLTNDDPQLKNALKGDIHGILDLTGGSFENREEVESQLADLLADIVMRGVDEDSVRDQILSILGPGVSIEEADEIFKKLIECANETSLNIDPDGTPNFMTKPAATSTPRKQWQAEKSCLSPTDEKASSQNRRKAENEYKNDLLPKVKEWLTNNKILKNDADIDAVATELANDFIDRQKYLQLNPDARTSFGEELEHMKYQVYKRLNKLLGTEEINTVMPKVPILMNSIKKVPVPQLTKATGDEGFGQEELEEAISDWIKKSPVYKKQNEKYKAMLNKVAPDLADALTSALQPFKTGTSNEDPDEMLVGEIVNHLKKSLPPRQISITSLREMGNDLLKHLKGLELLSVTSNISDQAPVTSPITQFNDAVTKWCKDLPFPNTEQGNKARQDMGNKIMAKVGELNMNPQILNDDILYEDMMSDFIDQQLNAIPGVNNKEELKSELMNEVNKLRQPLKEKMAGQAYKQQLRDTIPKSLPSIENPTKEDEASFEIMKDNLADAFINLNFTGDAALKEKYKNKINDEIDKFANNYMSRRPNTPLSTSQLRKDLISAMKKVDVPGDASMKSEVEQARMKDIIDDWVKELPLNKQSPVEELQTNKVLKAMTQRLLDLEKENELNPSSNYDERLVKEIGKYVKKLPVSGTINMDDTGKKLAEKIKATEHSRTFTEGSRRSIDIEDTPSADDRARSSGLCRHCKSLVQPSRNFGPCCKDAAVSPQPIDHGSQTDVATRHNRSAQCRCSATEIPRPIQSPCSSRSQIRTVPCETPKPRVSTGSQIQISPYVIVKEYEWNDEPNERIPDCPSQASLHSLNRNRCHLGGVSPDSSYTIPCREKTPDRCFNTTEFNRCVSPPRRREAARETLDCHPIPSRPSCHYLPRKAWSRPHIYRDNDPTCIPRDSGKCGCRGQVPKCRQVPQCPGHVPKCQGHVPKCPGHVPKCPGQVPRCQAQPPKCPEQKPKCRRPTVVTCQTCLDDPMKLCPKCCGAPCPHPTNFFFK